MLVTFLGELFLSSFKNVLKSTLSDFWVIFANQKTGSAVSFLKLI